MRHSTVIRKHITPAILAAIESGDIPRIRGGLQLLLRRMTKGNLEFEFLKDWSVYELCMEIDEQGRYAVRNYRD